MAPCYAELPECKIDQSKVEIIENDPDEKSCFKILGKFPAEIRSATIIKISDLASKTFQDNAVTIIHDVIKSDIKSDAQPKLIREILESNVKSRDEKNQLSEKNRIIRNVIHSLCQQLESEDKTENLVTYIPTLVELIHFVYMPKSSALYQPSRQLAKELFKILIDKVDTVDSYS